MEATAMTGHARLSRHSPPAPTLAFGFDDDVPIEHDPLDPHPEYSTPLELVVRQGRMSTTSTLWPL
ncbi:hypothetical protein [Nocardia sp. NPDC051570]|uniref:hypothetical protein n=1 Tax=Nocardia sp. NPDC051570 TaxID=3364324 RepID=UPI00378DD76F